MSIFQSLMIHKNVFVDASPSIRSVIAVKLFVGFEVQYLLYETYIMPHLSWFKLCSDLLVLLNLHPVILNLLKGPVNMVVGSGS